MKMSFIPSEITINTSNVFESVYNTTRFQNWYLESAIKNDGPDAEHLA